MKDINLKIFFFNVVIFNIIKKIFGIEICSEYTYCDNCKICNITNDISCGYNNLFCLNDNHKINFLYYLKSYYVNHFNNKFRYRKYIKIKIFIYMTMKK